MMFSQILLIENCSGQLGIFSANWEKLWYQKLDPVLYREKAMYIQGCFKVVKNENF